MVQTNFQNFLDYVGDLKRAWQGHAPFLLENYYRIMVEFLCMIIFASCRHSSKFCRVCKAVQKGVIGPRPFFITRLLRKNGSIFLQASFLHCVGNNTTNIKIFANYFELSRRVWPATPIFR